MLQRLTSHSRLILRFWSEVPQNAAELRAILEALAEHGKGLTWFILFWDGLFLQQFDGGKTVELSRWFQDSRLAVRVSWSELVALAEEPSQIVDAIVVAYDLSKRALPWAEGEEPAKHINLTDYRYGAEMYIEMDDGGRWEVESAWAEDIDALRAAPAIPPPPKRA